jgi:hypothetical protein
LFVLDEFSFLIKSIKTKKQNRKLALGQWR